jgi:hypothetical protein
MFNNNIYLGKKGYMKKIKFCLLFVLAFISCVSNETKRLQTAIGNAQLRNEDAIDRIKKGLARIQFNASDFPNSTVLERNLTAEPYIEIIIEEFNIKINIPGDSYVVTRDKYTAGIEREHIGKITLEDFEKNKCYFWGSNNNYWLEIFGIRNKSTNQNMINIKSLLKEEFKYTKCEYTKDYIAEYKYMVFDITEIKHYDVHSKLYYIEMDDAILIFKFGIITQGLIDHFNLDKEEIFITEKRIIDSIRF